MFSCRKAFILKLCLFLFWVIIVSAVAFGDDRSAGVYQERVNQMIERVSLLVEYINPNSWLPLDSYQYKPLGQDGFLDDYYRLFNHCQQLRKNTPSINCHHYLSINEKESPEVSLGKVLQAAHEKLLSIEADIREHTREPCTGPEQVCVNDTDRSAFGFYYEKTMMILAARYIGMMAMFGGVIYGNYLNYKSKSGNYHSLYYLGTGVALGIATLPTYRTFENLEYHLAAPLFGLTNDLQLVYQERCFLFSRVMRAMLQTDYIPGFWQEVDYHPLPKHQKLVPIDSEKRLDDLRMVVRTNQNWTFHFKLTRENGWKNQAVTISCPTVKRTEQCRIDFHNHQYSLITGFSDVARFRALDLLEHFYRL